MPYTIGELARRSGLTARALRHYEALGLVQPSGRTPAGYRVYTEHDVLTLHRVLAYQQTGLPLKEIAPLLGPDAPPLDAVLERQIALAEAQLARQQRLLMMLKRVQRRAGAGEMDLAEHLLKLVNFMRTCERYFTDEDLQKITALQGRLSDDEVKRLKAEFGEITQGLNDAMVRGDAPGSERPLALARRLLALSVHFPEDEDPAMRERGRAMLANEPDLQRETGLTPALVAYMDQALEAAKKETT